MKIQLGICKCVFRTGVRGFHFHVCVAAASSSLSQRGTAMPSSPSARVHAEHTCKMCFSRPSVWNLILQSIHAAASDHPVVTFLFSSKTSHILTHLTDPVFWTTPRLRGSHWQFVSHTHWVLNYYTFVYGRWPEGSSLKLLQWLRSDYFLKLSLLGQLPQVMVSVFCWLLHWLLWSTLVFFSSCCVLGLCSPWGCFFI